MLLSIMAFYNWDNSIFDNFQIPSGINRDDLTENLLFELAEMELVYSDFEIIKTAIGMWSRKELEKWTKLYETTQLDYDPIENYNRVEISTDLETRDLASTDNETRDLASTNNETRDLAGSNKTTGTNTTTSANNGSDISTEKVSAYNETDNLTTKSQTENVLGTSNTTTDIPDLTENITDSGTVNKTMSDNGTINKSLTDSGTINNTRNSTIKGNIGVTTSQQMIEQERKVLEFNIYDYIIDSFKTRFCILKY